MKEKNKEIHSICKIYVNKFRKHNRFDQVGIYEGKKKNKLQENLDLEIPTERTMLKQDNIYY